MEYGLRRNGSETRGGVNLRQRENFLVKRSALTCCEKVVGEV